MCVVLDAGFSKADLQLNILTIFSIFVVSRLPSPQIFLSVLFFFKVALTQPAWSRIAHVMSQMITSDRRLFLFHYFLSPLLCFSCFVSGGQLGGSRTLHWRPLLIEIELIAALSVVLVQRVCFLYVFLNDECEMFSWMSEEAKWVTNDNNDDVK